MIDLRLFEYAEYANLRSDPLWVREILLLFLSYETISSYYSSGIQEPFSNYFTFKLFSSSYFIAIMVYVIFVSSSSARLFETGSFQMIMTFPIRVERFFSINLIVQTLYASILFMIPAIIFFLMINFALPIISLMIFFLLIFSTLFFYSTIGLLFSLLNRNAILTFSLMFAFFLFDTGYANSIFGNYPLMRGILLGIYTFSFYSAYNKTIISAGLIELTISLFLFAFFHISRIHFDLRSGRA